MPIEGRPAAPSTRGGISGAACAALLALALSACASFGGGQTDQKSVDPNLFPADYKTSLMAFLQNDPSGLVGVRDAGLSAPELKPFGTESRYVACMRATGPDWSKQKMIVFYGGTINQFIDATSEACGTAAYQPFPEIVTLLNRLNGSKK